MDVVGHGVFVDFADATFLRTDTAGKIAEMVNRQRNVGIECFAHGFAIVHGLGVGELFEVGFDAIGDFQQNIGAFCRRGFTPAISG